MTRTTLALSACLVFVAAALGQPKDAITKVEASFDPVQAKRGQTVTLKITVQLADGYHTYPVVQPTPEAKYSVNKITFLAADALVFVGETVDPLEPKVKKGEDHQYLVYPGGGTWTRKVVVRPTAKPEETAVKVQVRLMVCDEERCFPPKTFDLEAKLKVLDEPAVPVEAKYKTEVEKAQKK
jgi:Thiol:disulfide interchange protein DsbD, N-terminal